MPKNVIWKIQKNKKNVNLQLDFSQICQSQLDTKERQHLIEKHRTKLKVSFSKLNLCFLLKKFQNGLKLNSLAKTKGKMANSEGLNMKFKQ